MLRHHWKLGGGAGLGSGVKDQQTLSKNPPLSTSRWTLHLCCPDGPDKALSLVFQQIDGRDASAVVSLVPFVACLKKKKKKHVAKRKNLLLVNPGGQPLSSTITLLVSGDLAFAVFPV